MARRSLRDHISTENSHSMSRIGDVPEAQALTPLASRLLSALRHLAKEYDELSMLIRGFEKMHRRNPWSDEEIHDTMVEVRRYINIILGETTSTATTTVVDTEVHTA